MKKLIKTTLVGAVALMLLLPNLSLAELTGGLKIGGSLASMHGDTIKDLEEYYGVDTKSKLGLCAGGFITFTIAGMFAIQPEVLFTMKGTKGELSGLEYKISLSYLEIPVLAKLLITTPGMIKPCLFAGPSLAIKLSGKEKVTYDGTTYYEGDLEGYKDIDFGLIIGAGIDFGLGAAGGKITVDLRYNLGFTNISDWAGEDVKNGAFSLMAGYSF